MFEFWNCLQLLIMTNCMTNGLRACGTGVSAPVCEHYDIFLYGRLKFVKSCQ